VGIGRAALKYVIEKAPQRAIAYTSFTRQTDSTVFQVQVAQAALKIDSAHLRAFRAADEIDDLARRNESQSYITRARVRADTGVVASDTTDALNTLIFAHGAGSFAEASPMQRWWCDSNTAARHAIVHPAIGAELYGKALLAVENTGTPLVKLRTTCCAAMSVLPDVMQGRAGLAGRHDRLRTRVQGRVTAQRREPCPDYGKVVFQRDSG